LGRLAPSPDLSGRSPPLVRTGLAMFPCFCVGVPFILASSASNKFIIASGVKLPHYLTSCPTYRQDYPHLSIFPRCSIPVVIKAPHSVITNNVSGNYSRSNQNCDPCAKKDLPIGPSTSLNSPLNQLSNTQRNKQTACIDYCHGRCVR